MPQQPKYHFQKAPYLGFVAENNCCHLHLHRQVELSYITDGEQTFTIDGTDYHLTAGDLVIVFPNQLHRLDTPVYAKAITSIFDPNLTDDYTRLLTAFHFDSCVFHKDELAASTLAAFNELAKTGISKSYKMHAVPFAEKGWLTVILADILSRHTLIPYEPTSPSYIISGFFNYVEAHIDKDLSLETIADALHISPSRLSACISSHTGKTPHAMVTARRLDCARPLLYKTTMSIADIAKAVGFSSERSFYRNFKEAYDKTPLEFRRKKTAASKNTTPR